MNPRYRPVGPRGLALLAVAGLVGLLLAVHGWAGRSTQAAFGSIGGSTSGQARPSASSSPQQTQSSAPAPTSGAQTHSPGPKLSSQSFAQYSFQVWPGKPSQAAQAALTGLSVTVHRQGAGISVIAGVSGQPASAPQFYPQGARVYVVEASLGDDSGGADYNLGDDGIIVTDAAGRILQ